MSDEKVYSVPATEIPGMRVAYQFPVGDKGQVITYEVALDATCSRQDLDELLDRLGGAAMRRKAIFDLPFNELSLAGARAMLPEQRKERAKAVALQEAHVLRMSENRRGNVKPLETDVHAVVNLDNNIMALQRRIIQEEKMVEYLKAIRDGADPNTLSAVDDETLAMAAE